MYYKWNAKDVEILLKEYIENKLPVREIHNKHLKHISTRQITKKILRLKISREIDPDEWTETEIKILTEKYHNIEKINDMISFLPKRTLGSIQRKASLMGLKRDNKVRRKSLFKNNLINLLDGSLESFYWMGFIFADGSIDKNGELAVEISKKDIKHLQKWSSF